jgi:integrase
MEEWTMANVAGYVGEYFIKANKKDKEKSKKMWFYCLSLGKKANGKRDLHKKRGFETEKKAKEALRKAQVEADNGRYIKPSKLAFGDYINEWFETRKDKLGRMTTINAETNIKRHVLPHIGHILLSELNVIHIEKYLRDLREKGLAEGTIKKVFSLVSSSLISAVRKDIIPKNAAALAENKPKVKRRLVEVWDEHEARDFLAFIQQSRSRYYIAFLLALSTGMRQGEILGLRWKDIDFKHNLITVRQTLSHDGKEFGVPKTEHSIRSIKIDVDTTDALKQHKKVITKEKWNAQKSYVDKDLVACTVLGTQCMPRDLEKRWAKLREDSGLRKITFHDLRHTHASLLLKDGHHPKVVSERLGHSSIQITLDLYSHLFPNLQS